MVARGIGVLAKYGSVSAAVAGIEHNHDGFENDLEIKEEVARARISQIQAYPLAIGKVVAT